MALRQCIEIVKARAAVRAQIVRIHREHFGLGRAFVRKLGREFLELGQIAAADILAEGSAYRGCARRGEDRVAGFKVHRLRGIDGAEDEEWCCLGNYCARSRDRALQRPIGDTNRLRIILGGGELYVLPRGVTLCGGALSDDDFSGVGRRISEGTCRSGRRVRKLVFVARGKNACVRFPRIITDVGAGGELGRLPWKLEKRARRACAKNKLKRICKRARGARGAGPSSRNKPEDDECDDKDDERDNENTFNHNCSISGFGAFTFYESQEYAMLRADAHWNARFPAALCAMRRALHPVSTRARASPQALLRLPGAMPRFRPAMRRPCPAIRALSSRRFFCRCPRPW